jgi:hypothetical protein
MGIAFPGQRWRSDVSLAVCSRLVGAPAPSSVQVPFTIASLVRLEFPSSVILLYLASFPSLSHVPFLLDIPGRRRFSLRSAKLTLRTTCYVCHDKANGTVITMIMPSSASLYGAWQGMLGIPVRNQQDQPSRCLHAHSVQEKTSELPKSQLSGVGLVPTWRFLHGPVRRCCGVQDGRGSSSKWDSGGGPDVTLAGGQATLPRSTCMRFPWWATGDRKPSEGDVLRLKGELRPSLPP